MKSLHRFNDMFFATIFGVFLGFTYLGYAHIVIKRPDIHLFATAIYFLLLLIRWYTIK